MTVVRRTIRSVPQRTAAQTWEVIVDVIAPTKGSARDELLSIAGIASSILAEEITSESPDRGSWMWASNSNLLSLP